MSNKTPFFAVVSGVQLSATLTAIGGDSTSNGTRLGGLDAVALSIDYTRHASSTTGRPVIAVDLSRDPPDTAPASVAHWQPYYAIDSNSFSSGAVEAYVYRVSLNPTATGTTTFGWPGSVQCGGYHWIRIRMTDIDTTNRGTVTVYLGGAT